MRLSLAYFLLYAIILSKSVKCAKILAIFPFCGPSQYLAGEPLLKALAARGHELTVISHHPQKKKVENFTDITLVYEGYDDFIRAFIDADNSVVMDIFFEHAKNITLSVLENPAVQQLLRTKSTKFDLIIVETMLNEALYAFAPHFNAHLVGFSTLGTDVNLDTLVGNISPISFIPMPFANFTDRMNFWERLENLKANVHYWYDAQYRGLPWQREIYRKYFPHLKHDLESIRRNFSLMLLNQHFSLSFPRPYVPNMIEVGGLFIQDQPKALPKEMADFLENAPNGVIYFSLGSNVKSEFLPLEKLKMILKVFGSLKQRVMFKYERADLPDKPANVFISKWFPQSDILAHRNLKLFITHGGLLSTIEAIYHAKPLVAIPVFFDQFLNARRAESAGYSLTLNLRNFKGEQLKAAIENVLENDSFRKAIEMRSRLFHDQPIKPLEKAIYWTEYILRHNGAVHMRVAAQDLNFWEYHSLDILGFFLGIISVAVIILVLVINYSIKFLWSRNIKTLRKNKKL